MIISLMLASALVGLVFLVVLAVLALRIAKTLERIGANENSSESIGQSSYLALIAFGVRAIEVETSHVGPQVTRLNENLGALAGGLEVLNGGFAATHRALKKQGG